MINTQVPVPWKILTIFYLGFGNACSLEMQCVVDTVEYSDSGVNFGTFVHILRETRFESVFW